MKGNIMFNKIILLLTMTGFTSAFYTMSRDLRTIYCSMSPSSRMQIDKIQNYIIHSHLYKFKLLRKYKTFAYTKHALQRLESRNITKEQIEQVMRNTPKNNIREHQFDGITVVAARNTIITVYKNKNKKRNKNIKDNTVNTMINDTTLSINPMNVNPVEKRKYAPDILVKMAKYDISKEQVESIIQTGKSRKIAPKKIEYTKDNISVSISPIIGKVVNLKHLKPSVIENKQ